MYTVLNGDSFDFSLLINPQDDIELLRQLTIEHTWIVPSVSPQLVGPS